MCSAVSSLSTARHTSDSDSQLMNEGAELVGKSPLAQLEVESENASVQRDEDIVFPDGGLAAWTVVLGGFFLSFSTFGYVVSWGTFQEYYQTVILRDHSSSAIAWIGSLQYSLIFLPGLITGRLFDLGYFRPSLIASTVVYTVANFLIAECHLYWHFILCQGLALGLSAGWIYIPCIAVVSHWFKVKRPVAFSIVSFGSSLGGVIFPIIFRQLLPKVGFKWTVRVNAFINLACFLIANVTMRSRLPPKGSTGINFSKMVSVPYVLYVFATFLAFLGLYTPLTFISVSAVAIGFDASLAFYLVAVANATSAVGRILGGGIALKFGALNVMIVFTTLAAVMTYVWPFVTNHGGFIAVVCIYGLASGAFVSLFPVPVAQLGETHDVGVRTGVQMTVMALGALGGPPISGAIQQHTGSFQRVGEYAGSMVIGSILFMILVRWTKLGSLYRGKF